MVKTVAQPRGAPAHPLGTDALLAKLWDNCRHREVTGRRRQMTENLLHLAELHSITELTSRLYNRHS